jgi:4-hydroxy-tetrahydrodipicolinate synthase
MAKIEGCYVACITPMKESEALNFETFKQFLDFLADGGIGGITALGSTGEFATMTVDERKKAAEVAIEHVNGRVPVMIGCSAVTTKEAVDIAEHAEKAGADSLLLISPWYNKPSEEELFEHFKTVAKSVNIPIMIYNNPGVSGIDLLPAQLLELMKHDNLDYVKESSGDLRRVSDILKKAEPGSVFGGADDIALESFRLDATGWISVVANVIPGKSQEVYTQYKSGNHDKAREIYDFYYPLSAFFESPNWIQKTKAALNLMGMNVGPCRKPRLDIPQEEKEILTNLLKNANLI